MSPGHTAYRVNQYTTEQYTTTQLYVVVLLLDLLPHEFPWRLKRNVVVVAPSTGYLLTHCLLSRLKMCSPTS